MSDREVRAALTRIEALGEGDEKTREMTRLAWRPAWAIRSRRGAIAAVLDMIRRR